MIPLRRHMEQLQRRGSTMPCGKTNSSTTRPQWQLALCLGRTTTPATLRIMRDSSRLPGTLARAKCHGLARDTSLPGDGAAG